jgi:hypothetical protein
MLASPCAGQKKNAIKTPGAQQIESPKDVVPEKPFPKATIPIIREMIPAKEKAKTQEIEPLFEKKETVIIIKGPKTEIKKTGKKTDTVIVLSKDSLPPKSAAMIPKAIPEKPAKNESSGKKMSLEMDNEGNCGCIEMTVKTSDTLEYQQYINYTVKFKNNCKETVYINSSSFHFVPFNYFGYPVRTIRKMSFVKHFDLPPFVKLEPNEIYEFRFADDPFFEYDLRRHEQYKFSFIHNNKTEKYKAAPAKTYLCSRYEDKMIFVK